MHIFDYLVAVEVRELLVILFIIIIALWGYLFSISFKSHIQIPTIDIRWNNRDRDRDKYDFTLDKVKKDIINSNNQTHNKNNNNARYNNNYHNKNLHSSSKVSQKESFQQSLPFVSVIVPARNEEKYIQRCLLSILTQNYHNFEVIVLDDNSTDNTLKIISDIKKDKSKSLPVDRLKVISLNGKPDDWAGKTWAANQGYLHSSANILLFTDADTNYVNKNVISLTVSYMQNRNLDVLTAIVSSERLDNFWANSVIPLWNLVKVLFGVSIGDVNNPNSKIAYLMGSFFIIKRKVFEDIGTFASVRGAIQEDKALAVRIKRNGYKLQLVRLKEMISSPWPRDLSSLWYGIGRTLAPLVIRNKFKIIINLLIIFLISVLPFIVFPYTFSIAIHHFSSLNLESVFQFDFFYLLLLNIICCLIVISSSIVKCRMHKLSSVYSLMTFFAAIFLTVASLYNIIPLLIGGKTKPIKWRGREYRYDKEQEGFSI